MDGRAEKPLTRPLREAPAGVGVGVGVGMRPAPDAEELLSVAGHDLRAPVATLVHYVDSEAAAGRLDDAQARVIQAQARQLLAALDTLMAQLRGGGAAEPAAAPRVPARAAGDGAPPPGAGGLRAWTAGDGVPAPGADGPGAWAAADAAPAPNAGGPCVWVVEDCDYAAAALLRLLRQARCRVLHLADGRALVRRLQAADCARPALVVTDFHMPGPGGAEVLRAVQARWPGLPVVCTTARDDGPGLAARGFAAVLPKPVEAARLRQVLAALLAPAAGAGHPAPPPRPSLPPAELAELRTLARLGAVSDLLDRCAELGAAHAAWQPFLSRLSALAGQGDFAGCMALLQD